MKSGEIIFSRMQVANVKNTIDRDCFQGTIKQIVESRKSAFKYRKQYLNPWEVHEAQREDFFRWLEVKRWNDYFNKKHNVDV